MENKILFFGTSNTTQKQCYTVPSGTKAILSLIHIVNTTGNPLTISVHIVPSGSSPSADNAIFYREMLKPYGYFQNIAPFNLEAQYSVYVTIHDISPTSNILTIFLSGAEITTS